MKDTIQHVKSKLKKTAVLLESPILRSFVPETKLYSVSTMRSMLIKHGMIYVKPDEGRFGRGVMKVEATRNIFGNHFWMYYDDCSEYYSTLSELMLAVDQSIPKRKYLVQKGIHMLTYSGRPFDIRIVVQLTPNKRWVATGIVARVAGPLRIVTNFKGGGSAHEVSPLLAGYLPPEDIPSFVNKLFKLSRYVAIYMQKSFPRIKELGLDLAIDMRMHPWILEVNTRPDPAVFKALDDQTMYKRIVSYARVYGKRV